MPCYRIYDNVVCDFQTPPDKIDFIKPVSGLEAPSSDGSYFDGKLLSADDFRADQTTEVALEVHINATWTRNEAIGDTSDEDVSTFSSGGSDGAQSDWFAFG